MLASVRFEEHSDVGAGRGGGQAFLLTLLFELLSGHATVTDGAQRAQIVHVALSAPLHHRLDVVHLPELQIDKYTFYQIPNCPLIALSWL